MILFPRLTTTVAKTPLSVMKDAVDPTHTDAMASLTAWIRLTKPTAPTQVNISTIGCAEWVEMFSTHFYLHLPHPHQAPPALPLLSLAITNIASYLDGTVTASTIVVMVLMKRTVPLKSLPPVLLTTLHAITTGVSLKRGCAMVTMTVATAPMNTTAVSPFSAHSPSSLLLLP